MASITLTDRKTKKSASLDDPQACRAILAAVCERIGADDSWKSRYPAKCDGTERVAVQILRKTGGAPEAAETIKRGESLEWILEGTDLATDVGEASHKGDRPATQVPLPKGKDLTQAQDDVAEKLEELWGLFVQRIEATEGEKSQTIQITTTWNPPTKNRDGYVSFGANMSISTGRSTRTAVVSKRRGGGFQFNLFAEAADE